MGIRNLALCSLHVPSSSSSPVKITNWERLSEDPESFEPIDLAAKAYSLIKHSLEKYDPHTILIERQRYRSGGGSAILEWTIRVNMLEAMFHSILYTLAQQRKERDFVVHSVSPRRMTQFWLDDIEEKLNARETKLAKIEVAKEIVAGTRLPIKFSGEAKDTAEAFGVKIRGSKGDSKFDDLADSLLQGLGWLQWDINRTATFAELMTTQVEPEDIEDIKPKKSKSKRSRVAKIDTSEASVEKTPKSRTKSKRMLMMAT
jgi:hypothetical protein